MVGVGRVDGDLRVVDRRRIELVDEEWAKQPYHAAEMLPPPRARELVKRGVDAAHRLAVREMRAAIARERDRGNHPRACAVLVGNPMPDWSVDEILAVHFRMHKAEGVLFRDALLKATGACGLQSVAIREPDLPGEAERVLGASMARLTKTVAALGKTVGPPWGKDQKDATLAALVALGR